MKKKPNPYVQHYKKLHRQKKNVKNFLDANLPLIVKAAKEKLNNTLELIKEIDGPRLKETIITIIDQINQIATKINQLLKEQ